MIVYGLIHLALGAIGLLVLAGVIGLIVVVVVSLFRDLTRK